MPNPYRIVWMFVMYDLPVTSPAEMRAANRFRHDLENLGFERLQYSVYKRFCGTLERYHRQCRQVRKFLPPTGQVRVFSITDRQYGSMQIYEKALPRKLSEIGEEARPAQLQLF